LKNKYKIKDLCEFLGIKHDAYYYKPHPKSLPEEQIKQVKLSFYGSNRAYGGEKIAEELRQNGMPISEKTVRKIMRQEGLVSKYIQRRKKGEPKTNKDPINNKLDRVFGGYKPKEVMVSDLTYVDINNKWHYICLIVELSHREIIGFSAGKNKDAKLVQAAIYSIKGSLRDIGIFHTDRGGEFKNDDIEKILKTFGIERSLSRPGKPIDNAVAESMYDILKTEFVYDEIFTSLENLQKRLADWVWWYNNKRLHGSLGLIPPVKSRESCEIGVAWKPKYDYAKNAVDKSEKERATVIISEAFVDISSEL